MQKIINSIGRVWLVITVTWYDDGQTQEYNNFAVSRATQRKR
jgi:hypothetical protein